MNNLKDKELLFDEWLSNYQKDFEKIVNKFRLNHHPLKTEEIISEINLGMLKKKSKLLEGDNSLDSEISFKKAAYAYARNFIAWTADGASNKDKKYLSLRKDQTIKTEEDGDISFFEYIAQTIGEKDPFFEKLNQSKKYKNIFKWIMDYSEFLSPRQKNLLNLILEGHKFNKIAELTGVTHQAISFAAIEVFNNIKNHVKIDIKNENSDQKLISKGYESVNFLFGENRVQARSLKKKMPNSLSSKSRFLPKNTPSMTCQK